MTKQMQPTRRCRMQWVRRGFLVNTIKVVLKKNKELNYVEIIKLETAKVLVIENSQELCKKENQFDTEMNELIYK